MEQLLDVSLGSVSLKSAALRLLGAIVLGGLIGWEREVSARAAGLRTHMMIALAAAVFAILGMELSAFDVAEGVRVQADPLRLIDAVTSGVAFLAAGSIIFSGGSVRGVTTGASMWLCGAIGLQLRHRRRLPRRADDAAGPDRSLAHPGAGGAARRPDAARSSPRRRGGRQPAALTGCGAGTSPAARPCLRGPWRKDLRQGE